MNGILYPVKHALGAYMVRWYEGVYPDTNALSEFISRGADKAMTFVPARMVDAVEDMLKSYQKNNTSGVAGANALFPVVFVGMAKDYTPSGAETGARQMGRQMVALSAEPGSSVYGYRQAMGDVRVQVAILAADALSGESLAAQFSLFIGEVKNRRFSVPYVWGQYSFSMPCVLESPDILFSNVAADSQGMTILVADLTLKMTLPFLDAPKDGEDNDGSTNNPPGYPLVDQINVHNMTSLVNAEVTEAGVEYLNP